MQSLLPEDPQRLGSYRLLGRLGAGGMGRVYLARSPGGRTVAVKVVRPELAEDRDFRRRFRHEVDVAQAVSGRFTAPVVDADADAALPWLATSYVLGPSLTDVVDRHGPLPEGTVRALGAGLAAALGEIHAAGLVHRDLKPSNVLLAADGPRVIDFGIARAVDGDRLTQTGVVVGSPGFMSPEQARGEVVGPAGDVFSLGTVLAFAVTGRSAFGDAGPAAMLYKVVHEEPDLADVPEALAEVVAGCLEKDPAARPLPVAVSARLTPDGLDDAFTDWLPGAVSSTIATHAARILDLDTPPEGTPSTTERADGTMVLGGSGRRRTGGDSDAGSDAGGYAATEVDAGGDGGSQAGTRTTDHGTGSAGDGDEVRPEGASRRRMLGIAAGVVGVTVVGGGAGWFLTREDSAGNSAADDAKAKPTADPSSSEPEPDVFTTPPNGQAPKPLWDIKTTTLGPYQPYVRDGHVYVSDDGAFAYDLKSGDKVWEQPGVKLGRNDMPALSGGRFFYKTDAEDRTQSVVGLRVGSGKENWRTRLVGGLEATNVLGADAKSVYVAAKGEPTEEGETRSWVVAIDIATREVRWREPYQDTNYRTFAGGFAPRNHLLYISDDTLTARRKTDGKVVWERPDVMEHAFEYAVHGNLLLLGGNQLCAVDLDTGRNRWTHSPESNVFLTPNVYDGVVYVFEGKGPLWAYDAGSGDVRWKSTDLQGKPSCYQVVKTGDSLYGGSVFDDGGVYAIDAKNGELRWTYNDGEVDSDGWKVSAAGKRLVVQHGYLLYCLPAV